MKLFYKKLIAAFEAQENKDRYRSAGIRPVQFVDLYAGQDYNPEHFEGHNYPALLVHWEIDYRAAPPVATITATLCYEQLRDTSSLGKNTTEALKFIDFIEITDEILKTIQTEHTGQMSLISESPKLDDTVVDVYTLVYQCSYSGKLPQPGTGYVKGEIKNLAVKQGLYSKLLE